MNKKIDIFAVGFYMVVGFNYSILGIIFNDSKICFIGILFLMMSYCLYKMSKLSKEVKMQNECIEMQKKVISQAIKLIDWTNPKAVLDTGKETKSDFPMLEKMVHEIIYEDRLDTFEGEAPIDIAKSIDNLLNENKFLKNMIHRKGN